MPSKSDVTLVGPDCGDALALAVNPFVANHYHFGMLLGVDDLETDQGYHRGKIWLHNAWLHGSGVVWGLGVSVRAEVRQLVVAPGMALTPAGREVYLDREYCIDVARWLEAAPPGTIEVTQNGDERSFVVHVVIGSRHCLDRPVPSIAEPCGPTAGFGSQGETAYSREVEAALLEVRPGEPPAIPLDYPRLRAFVGVAAAGDDALAQEIEDAYAAIEALPTAERGPARAEWLRRFAADDVTARVPYAEGQQFPAPDDATALLARVRVVLTGEGAGQVLRTEGADPTVVDHRVRTPLVATVTLQGLVAGLDTQPIAGPQLVPGSAELEGTELRFAVSASLAPATVTEEAFAVTALTAAGWQDVAMTAVTSTDENRRVALTLTAEPPPDIPVRLVARGTGPTPLLGADGSPVAGGNDIAVMVRN